MKTYFDKIILLFFSIYLSTSGLTQTNTSTKKLPNEIVVRLNYKLLDWSVVDDSSLLETQVLNLLNDQGKEEYFKLSKEKFDIGTLKAEKIFMHYKTSDSISISRTGEKVRVPPFWATFLISKPDNMRFWDFHRELNRQFYPLVIYADSPIELVCNSMPNDEYFNNQISLDNPAAQETGINIMGAWEEETGRSFVKVGVYDTGIDESHPDIKVLTGKRYFLLSNQYSPLGFDENGHGTAVAGIIGAKRNNQEGIAGIAGGNGEDTSGVSLVDFKVGFDVGETSHNISVAIVDGARSVGSYFNWGISSPTVDDLNWQNAEGFGISIGNHSYSMRIVSPKTPDFGEDIDISDTLNGPTLQENWCILCKEAYLFSLRNGVTNVACRGNRINNSLPTGVAINDLTYPNDIIPPSYFDDSWYIGVGASGMDGKRLVSVANGIPEDGDWQSPVGQNIDVIAPGTKGSVVTLRSAQQSPVSPNKYKNFNGTSASAPHVTGLAALLMSKYNKPCYSNINLDPADVEYIVQKSATHVALNPGYDDSTGHGRLDASAAMAMIDFPRLQIIHPQEPYINFETLSVDTISVNVNVPMDGFYNGPIAGSFPLELLTNYKVVKYKIALTFDFSNYMTPSSDLLDIWVRHSATNSLQEYYDTAGVWQMIGTTGGSQYIIKPDTMGIEPMAYITESSPGQVTLEGYYYHFVKKYDEDFPPFSNNYLLPDPDVWFPINPFVDTARMAYSIYTEDPLAGARPNFPCDSVNLLYDIYAGISENQILDFKVYPNPSSGDLRIQLFGESKKSRIFITDVDGRIVYNEEINTNKKNLIIDNSTLQSGIYFIRLVSPDGTMNVKKWIKL